MAQEWVDPEPRILFKGDKDYETGVRVELWSVVNTDPNRSSSHRITVAFYKDDTLLHSWAPAWSQLTNLVRLIADVDPHFNDKVEEIHNIIHDKLIEEYKVRHGPE